MRRLALKVRSGSHRVGLDRDTLTGIQLRLSYLTASFGWADTWLLLHTDTRRTSCGVSVLRVGPSCARAHDYLGTYRERDVALQDQEKIPHIPDQRRTPSLSPRGAVAGRYWLLIDVGRNNQVSATTPQTTEGGQFAPGDGFRSLIGATPCAAPQFS